MPDLVERLTRLILQDNAIFFVGNQFTAVSDQRSYLHQIAAHLATHLQHVAPDQSLDEVATQYELDAGRTELIKALREALAALPDQSTSVYNLLADSIAPHTKIITTRFDQVLETALTQAHKSYIRIISDEEVPFFDESRITLIKIRGDISRAKSLLITADDVNDFFQRLPAVNDIVRAFFATKTMIFLGYDLDDPFFKRLFRQVTRPLSDFRRRAYAIVSAPLPPSLERYWTQQNVEIHVEEIVPFLQTLAETMHTVDRTALPESGNPLAALAHPPKPDHPYKSLDNFGRGDSAIFAGRRGETTRLAHRILAHPLTVLYGESGAGKSSLLQAGVAPKLAQDQSLLLLTAPVPGRALVDGWLADLTDVIPLTALPDLATEDFAAALRTQQAGLNGPVVLVVDQFEQLFVSFDDAARETAVAELRHLLDDNELNVHLVLVIREDFLGRLETLQTALPGLLDVRFRLGRLNAEAARSAIEHPLETFAVKWEPALVDRLLYDLQANHEILPPQLQIVCTHLYEDVAANDMNLITLDRYQALGGMTQILGDYVDQVVAGLPLQSQDVARLLLGALVSSSQVKLRLPVGDLARAAETDEATAVAILDTLTRHRLTRRYETDIGFEYELTHDYLARRIADWLGNAFWDAQRVRELLRQAVPAWETRQRLLAPGDLRLVNAQRGQVHFSDKETMLIYASAVSYDEDSQYWRQLLTPQAAEQVLLTLTNAPQSFVRARTAVPLAAFSDDEATVRRSAADAIATANHQPAIRRLIEMAAQPETAAAATSALVIVRDAQTAVGKQLPPSLRSQIRRRVWRRRWQHHKQACYAAAWRAGVGGFLGVGVGLGLIFAQLSVPEGMQDVMLQFAQGIVLFLILGGIVLTGTLAGIATLGGGFIRACVYFLADAPQKRWAWIVGSVATGVLLGIALMGLAGFLPGLTKQLWQNWLAGLLIGTPVALMATTPLTGKLPLRALLTIVVGVLAFLGVGLSGLSLNAASVFLVIAGVTTGAGFFWAFARQEG